MLRPIIGVLLLFVVGVVKGQSVSITAFGTPVSENFNSLAPSGTSESLPLGWYILEELNFANNSYAAGTGVETTGNTYSYGTGTQYERALGGLRSANLNPTFGAQFTNNTPGVIAEILITYIGEQWRMGAPNREDRLIFEYSIDATNLNTGDWSPVPTLNFVAPISTGAAGALDGNAPANRTTITATISNLFIPMGTSFWIRWVDFDADGSDDGLAIDDFSITALNPCNVIVSSFSPENGPAGTQIGRAHV